VGETVVEVKDIRVGLVSMGTYKFEPNISNLLEVKRSVESIASNSDIVIFIMHAGAEGKTFNHITGDTEWFFGENRGNPQQVAYTAIDAGADLVLGSGPHVLRGMENYNGKVIAYSLGNFGSVGGISTSGISGTTGILKIIITDEGTPIDISLTSVKLNRGGTAYYDSSEEGKNLINELSTSDFGQNAAIIP